MSPNNANLLIDHLDKSLEGKELEEVDQLIRNDEEAANEWKLLQFTASNIYEAGLYAQVAAVKDQYAAGKSNVGSQRTNGGIVRTMTRKMMRVAAVLLFVSISAVLYKYISVNDSKLYNEYYSSYELNTTRSLGDDNGLDNAYKNKNWNDVVAIVNGIQDKSSKHFFLAGVANLELKQYGQAINAFQSVINKNQVAGDDYFGDEAGYYLAMSYLANREADKAVPILEKIKKDKSHLYNQAVSKMGMDFTILAFKARN
ncbi:MAG: tetratricopeptide repeat protein [Chitinophagaceae bacterium]|nr:tetratricopeptide repeat protein [Chitinophagaceae bacterium]